MYDGYTYQTKMMGCNTIHGLFYAKFHWIVFTFSAKTAYYYFFFLFFSVEWCVESQIGIFITKFKTTLFKTTFDKKTEKKWFLITLWCVALSRQTKRTKLLSQNDDQVWLTVWEKSEHIRRSYTMILYAVWQYTDVIGEWVCQCVFNNRISIVTLKLSSSHENDVTNELAITADGSLQYTYTLTHAISNL